VRTVKVAAAVPLGPEAAVALWRDLRRWPAFVEGLRRIERQSQEWPAEGAKVTWESGAPGRGRVTEKVAGSSPTRLATEVFEDRLVGVQTFEAFEEGAGSRIELRFEYELARTGPLRGLTDVLFIRRALRDALARTLRRFAVEAEEEAGLR
jgi:Polyketide cyclase / dehydrase and lipid transport